MLAFRQQLLEAILGKLFTQPDIPESKGFIYDADNGTVMAISEEWHMEGSNPDYTWSKI